MGQGSSSGGGGSGRRGRNAAARRGRSSGVRRGPRGLSPAITAAPGFTSSASGFQHNVVTTGNNAGVALRLQVQGSRAGVGGPGGRYMGTITSRRTGFTSERADGSTRNFSSVQGAINHIGR